MHLHGFCINRRVPVGVPQDAGDFRAKGSLSPDSHRKLIFEEIWPPGTQALHLGFNLEGVVHAVELHCSGRVGSQGVLLLLLLCKVQVHRSSYQLYEPL